MDRRQFLQNSFFIAAGSRVGVLASTASAEPEPGAVNIELHPRKLGPTVPADFTGLGFETAQLHDPGFFAAQNAGLVAMVRRLGAEGVIRIGGNSSEFAVWTPEGDPDSAAAQAAADWAAKRRTEGKQHAWTATTPDAIQNLKTFLYATGWRLIYGINLGNNTLERAAAEAAFVWKTMRGSLIAFEVGNEPDLYSHNGIRSENYGFADFYADWRSYVNAILKRVPRAVFAGPDAANSVEWIEKFAARNREHRMAGILTGHYYAGGPPRNPDMNVARLLRTDDKLTADAARIMTAARKSGMAFRMVEGNSCFGGGKPGVSDTMASALWGADYMLRSAQVGYAGVNFQAGSRREMAEYAVGPLAGDTIEREEGTVPARDSPDAVSVFYSPIAGDERHGYRAKPLYYGMLLAQQFAGLRMMDCSVEAGAYNMSAYAADMGEGRKKVALINREPKDTVTCRVKSIQAAGASVWMLTGNGAESRNGIRFAGSEVDSAAHWKPTQGEKLLTVDDAVSVTLPPASAALLFT